MVLEKRFIMSYPHVPVLYEEVLKAFEDSHIQAFVDGTLGAGGHAHSILTAHPEIERFVGIDQDPAALDIAARRLLPWQNQLTLLRGNFSHLSHSLASLKIKKVDGILLDIGVSSMQLDQPEKGFSFSHDGPLDMRMDPQGPLTAAEIVNEWSEQDIGKVLRDYGEEKQWRAASRAIVAARAKGYIGTTKELTAILQPLFSWKKKGINPLTLIFQALRICVNKELEVLENVLPQAIDLLSPKGRLAVITFHSLEDRIVKNAMRQAASDKFDTVGIGCGLFLDKDPIVKLLTRKPICASDAELAKNPRCRSAKLRIIEKI